jgi:hypothetical protein
MNGRRVVSGQWSVVSEQGGRRKAEGGKPNARRSRVAICPFSRPTTNDQPPTSFPLPPSAFPLRARRGVSLLEVLISIFVLAVGLLGVLAIIPLGQMTIAESVKADRAGACGRAAMRDIKVRRMLDFRSWIWEVDNAGNSLQWGIGTDSALNPWFFPINDPDVADTAHNHGNNNGIVINNSINPPQEAFGSFMVDPLGRTKGLPSILYGIKGTPNYFPRRTLSAAYLNITTTRRAIDGTAFYWPDDLALDTPANAVERPSINSTATPPLKLDDYRSLDYSYLFTVSPSSSERWMSIPKRRFFDVTVVVFFKRNFNLTVDSKSNLAGFPEGEWMAETKDISGMPPGLISPGGGTITLGNNSGRAYAYRIKGNATNGQLAGTGTNTDSGDVLDLSNSLPPVRDGQWVMLWDSADGRLAWYRVIGVNFPDVPSATDQPTLTLDGPDWTVSQNHTEKLIVIDGAIGAYTSTVELDYDPLWQGMY